MILKNSALIAFFSAMSVLLGVIRDKLLAVTVGIGASLDIYNASFRIPDLIYGAFLAFITAGTVVPFLTHENAQGKMIESEKRFSSLLFFFSMIMILVIVMIGVTLPLYASQIVPGFSSEQIREFIFTTRLLMLQPLILGVSSLIGCFAQLKNEFMYYSIAPLGYSGGIILGILFLYQGLGVQGLIYGVLLGALLSLLVQSLSLTRHHFTLVRHNIRLAYIKELVSFAFPRSITNVISQLRVVFFTALATTFGPGILSAFLFAQRVTDAISQIISQSITTASLPVLAREHEEGRIEEHEKLVHKYTRILFGIAVMISFVLYPFRHAIVTLLYTHNNAGEMIAFFLVGFLIALPFSMASSYLVIGFYSMKDTKKVLLGNMLGTIASVFICYLMKDRGPSALLLGVIIYFGVSSVAYMILYKMSHFGKI